MNLFKTKNWLKKERGVSSNIPITHLPCPDVFETQDGQLGAIIKIKGIPYLTTNAEDLKQYQQIVHHCLLQLGPEFMLMETVHRRHESTILSNDSFTNDFCQDVHNTYHQQFSKGLYVNDIYLTLMYKGDFSRTNKTGWVNKLLSSSNRLMDKTIINAKAIERTKSIKCLNQKANLLQTQLSGFGTTRLGDNEEGYNSLISALSLVPNGGRPTYLASVDKYPKQSNTTSQIQANQQQYPRGHLSQYLANHRLFFGEAIQFQGNTLADSRFGAMLSIKTYGNPTIYSSLDSLLALDCEFIRTQSFAPLELAHALNTIKDAHSKKTSAEDDATSQLNELVDLADLVTSGKVSVGLHHNTLMIISPTKEDLDRCVNEAVQAYSKAKMVMVRETLAQDISFFAQIPGNSRFIARATPITSENFADFCSLHNTQSGYRDRCLLGEPVTLIQTPEKTPVFWNFHLPGSANNPSSGHTLFVGPNGSGKTAFACFLDSQMNRFKGHRTFYLDRNQGVKIYILACNGTYLNLAPCQNPEFTMNPFQLPDSEVNRDFCKNWMQALLLEEGEGSVDSSIASTINSVVDYGFDLLAPQDRKLSTIAALLPIDFPKWEQLKRWLSETQTRQAGQYAWAFDNDRDSLSLDANKVGFDLTYLMDRLPTYISTPFYMYLLHRIQLSLTGAVTSIVIDEMWQVLRSPYWSVALEQYLPTIRKLFGHIVGMTQSPESIINSPINHVLLNNNASVGLFANPKAKKAVYVDELGCTEAEFKLIQSNASTSRLLLYKQEHESILCHIDLTAIEKHLPVLSGNQNSVDEMDALRAELGRDAKDWLPAFMERKKCA